MIILASASPRRSELLKQSDIEFEVMAVDIDETVGDEESATDYVVRMAEEKAVAGFDACGTGQVTLGADTCVELEGRILVKPVDRADAERMLQSLSGNIHHVHTAVAAVSSEKKEVRLSSTEVRFKPLTENEITSYIATGEPMGKAGAYAIQGRAGRFVTNINGSYTGIVGLPLYETTELLRCFGVDS